MFNQPVLSSQCAHATYYACNLIILRVSDKSQCNQIKGKCGWRKGCLISGTITLQLKRCSELMRDDKEQGSN